MAVIPGEMRYKIKIITIKVTKDIYGADVTSTETLHTLRAARKQAGGGKGINNDEIFANEQIQFTTHYRSGITTKNEVEYNSKRYRILSVTEIGFKEGLQINTELINE